MDTFPHDTVEPGVPAPAPASGWRWDLSWSAIFAGALIALGFLALFVTFGAALGLSVIDPYQITRNENSAGWTVATIIWVALSGIAALFIGGWFAGHLGRYARENSIVQGALVWALAVVVVAGPGQVAASLARSRFAPPAAEPADSRPLAYGYSSLDDPQFAGFLLDRARNWRPGNPETPINVSADVQNRVNPKKVAKNGDIKRFVESNTGLTKSQTEEFLDQEKNEIAKAQADAQKRWEDKNAIELARADRQRKAASAAAWTLTCVAFFGLAAAIGGAYLGWYQRDHDLLTRHHTVRNA
jgi:hypothetical protein